MPSDQEIENRLNTIRRNNNKINAISICILFCFIYGPNISLAIAQVIIDDSSPWHIFNAISWLSTTITILMVPCILRPYQTMIYAINYISILCCVICGLSGTARWNESSSTSLTRATTIYGLSASLIILSAIVLAQVFRIYRYLRPGF